MVYRIQQTYDEFVDILDIKYVAESTIGYTIPPGVYKIFDINSILKCFLRNEVKNILQLIIIDYIQI